MSTEVAKRESTEVRTITPMDMLRVAVEQNADLDKLEKLMQLEREWKADRAKEAFVEAMTAFRSKPLKLVKNKHVKFTTNRGTTEYDHATLAQVVDSVVATLSEHGLSHRWETHQENGLVRVTCIITHVLGHSERTTLSAAPDESGGKNSIQAVGSTVTYLQRYTLMAATGLAASDMDKDGRLPESDESITAEQATAIEKLIAEIGTSRPLFLNWLKVDELIELPAKDYDRAMKQLDVLAKQKRK